MLHKYFWKERQESRTEGKEKRQSKCITPIFIFMWKKCHSTWPISLAMFDKRRS
jgi:hypothetical protein